MMKNKLRGAVLLALALLCISGCEEINSDLPKNPLINQCRINLANDSVEECYDELGYLKTSNLPHVWNHEGLNAYIYDDERMLYGTREPTNGRLPL